MSGQKAQSYRSRRNDSEFDEAPAPEKIRIKFETLSKRLSKLNVDIIHTQPENYNLQEVSEFHKDLGDYGCFTAQELERLRTLDTSQWFKRLNENLYDFVQSLPELILHQKSVVEVLVKSVSTFPARYLGCVFSVAAVFSRDMKDDIRPHFHKLFAAIIARVPDVAMSGGATDEESAPNPELTAQLFESLSYLLKADLEYRIENCDELTSYYGPVFGSPTPFVRDFATKTFAIVIRKLSLKGFKIHFKKLFKSCAAQLADALENNYSEFSEHFDEFAILSKAHSSNDSDNNDQFEQNTISYPIRRCQYLFDGMNKLLFYSLKGIQGHLHSKALKRFQILFKLFLSFYHSAKSSKNQTQSSTNEDEEEYNDGNIEEKENDGEGEETGAVFYQFLLKFLSVLYFQVIQKFFTNYLFTENQFPLLNEVLNALLLVSLKELHTVNNENPKFEEILLELYLALMLLLSPTPITPTISHYHKKQLKYHPLFLVLPDLDDITNNGNQLIKKKKQKKDNEPNNPLVPFFIESGILAFTLVHEQYKNGSSYTSFSDLLIEKSRELLAKIWLLFPTNSLISKQILPLGKDSLSFYYPDICLLFYAKELYLQLPTPSSKQLFLPVLFDGLMRLKPSSNKKFLSREIELTEEEWFTVVYKLLFILKDSRENTDVILSLATVSSTEVAASSSQGTTEFAVEPFLELFQLICQSFLKKIPKSQDILLHHNPSQETVTNTPAKKNKKKKHSKEQQESDEMEVATSETSKTIVDFHQDFSFLLLLKIMNWFLSHHSSLFELEIIKEMMNKIVNKYFQYMKDLSNFLENILLLPSFQIISASIHFYYDLSIFGQSTDISFLKKILKKLLFFFYQNSTSLLLSSTIAFLLDGIQSLIDVNQEGNDDDSSNEDGDDVESERKYLLDDLLSEKEDRASFFQAISDGFMTSNYFLKYYLTKIFLHLSPPILKVIPSKSVVVSSHENDHDDDEDDEGFSRKRALPSSTNDEENTIKIFPLGTILQEILLFPLNIANERQILRRLEILEVHSRNGKLSKEYLMIITSFTFGLFYLKYKPVWNACINILNTISQFTEKTKKESGYDDDSENNANEDEENDDQEDDKTTKKKVFGGEEIIWPFLSTFLDKVSQQVSSITILPENFLQIHSSSVLPLKKIYEFLEQNDSKDIPIPTEIKESSFFYLQIGSKTLSLPVPPDANTDNETIYLHLLEFMKKTSQIIVLKKSKFVVEHFIDFLNYIYYPNALKDPEFHALVRIGFLIPTNQLNSEKLLIYQFLTKKDIFKRLENFLKIFAVITSPKQLIKHGYLYALYHELLCKSDSNIAKLAFECILTYKPIYLMPYKDFLKNLYDEKAFRNELVNIDSDTPVTITVTDRKKGGGSQNMITEATEKDYKIKKEHREGFYHVIMRILYGRLLSKPTGGSKRNINDQIQSRRAAVIAFIIRTNVPAVRHFFYLMIRGIFLQIDYETIPSHADAAVANKKELFSSDIPKVNEFLSTGYDRVLAYHQHHLLQVNQTTKEEIFQEFHDVSWERLQGFLHLLYPIFNIFGISIKDYVNLLYQIILKVLFYAQQFREEQQQQQIADDIAAEELAAVDAMEIDEDHHHHHHRPERSNNEVNQAMTVRTLCLQRLSEFFQFYSEIVIISDPSQEIFSFIQPLIISFPSTISIIKKKKPALLILFEVIASHDNILSIITSQPLVIENIIKCIAYPNLEIHISKSIFMILNAFYSNIEIVKKSMIPFTNLLVTCFSQRFHFSKIETNHNNNDQMMNVPILKISDVIFKNLSSLYLELQLLTLIATNIFSDHSIVIQDVLISNFATIILGMLRSYFNSKKLRIHEDWVFNILKIYQSLIWRISDISNHFIFLSRLFGPVPSMISSSALSSSAVSGIPMGSAAMIFNKMNIRKQLLITFEFICHHPSMNQEITSSLAIIMKELVNYESNFIVGNRNIDTFIPRMKMFASTTITEASAAASTSFESIPFYDWNTLLGPKAYEKYFTTSSVVSSGKKSKKSTGSVAVAAPPSIKSIDSHLLICSAIIFESIRSLYEEEYPIRSSSLFALKKLISDLFAWAFTAYNTKQQSDEWISLIKTVIMPGIHKGIQISSDAIRSSFLSLLVQVIKVSHYYATTVKDINTTGWNEVFHTDLYFLLDENDSESDFFENITHLQLHRRSRAFMKLKNQLLSDQSTTNNAREKISISSYLHVFLPIGFYYLCNSNQEFNKKLHRPFLQEIASFIGAIAYNLPFNHYMTVLRKILKLLDRKNYHLEEETTKEKSRNLYHLRDGKTAPSDNQERQAIVQMALVSVLDSFHFDIHQPLREKSPLEEAEEEVNKMEVVEEDKENQEEEEEDDDDESDSDEEEEEEEEDAVSVEGDGRPDDEDDEDKDNSDEESNHKKKSKSKKAKTVPTSNRVVEEDDDDQTPKKNQLIGDVVIRFIFPTVKSFLLKDTKDHKNNKTKMVQTNIAIALTNLLKQLTPPLITKERKLDIFSNLIIDIIETLKSKDSHIRDVTRTCLIKIIKILGFQAFERILFEIQSILIDGYQRHVALYTIRSILTQITEHYQPPSSAKVLSVEDLMSLQTETQEFLSANNPKKANLQGLTKRQRIREEMKQQFLLEFLETKGISVPEFDQCIPLIMHFVILDLSDEIREERENTDGIIRKSTIRERKGNKFNEILEILSRSLLFRPTYALLMPSHPATLSSIHAISSPLLDFLNSSLLINQDDQADAIRTGRVAEALQRVAIGLSRNPSLDVKELLLYIHASLQPFVTLMLQQHRKYKQSIGKIVKQVTMTPAEAVEERKKAKKRKKMEENGQTPPTAAANNNNAFADENTSDMELILPSYLREESSDEDERFSFTRSANTKKSSTKNEIQNYQAATWLPKDIANHRTEQKAIIEERNRQQQELIRVQDGHSAPKLTGRNRYDLQKRSKGKNNGIEKSTLIAIKYCLTLLATCLKKGTFKPKHQNTHHHFQDLEMMEQEEEEEEKQREGPSLIGLSKEMIQEMLMPFIPILRSFLHIPNAFDIVILSIKCLSQLISQDIYFENKVLNAITNRILMILIQYNASKISAENELCQACLHLFFAVFKRYNRSMKQIKANKQRQQQFLQRQEQEGSFHADEDDDEEEGAVEEDDGVRPKQPPNPNEIKDIRTKDEIQMQKRQKQSLSAINNQHNNQQQQHSSMDYPLQEKKMRLLIESLTLSLLDSSSATSYQLLIYQLIREIISTHILLPEIYDLMNKLSDQIVLSNYKNIRFLSSKILIEFLIFYPMTTQKHLTIFKKLLSLCDYQYLDGKISAYETIYSIIKLFPLPVIEDYAMMIFLTMTLKLSNEKISSKDYCMSIIMNILLTLFQRISFHKTLLFSMEEMMLKWLNSIISRVLYLFGEGGKSNDVEGDGLYDLSLRSSIIQEEENISHEMIELVSVACRLFVIFIKSMNGGSLSDSNNNNNNQNNPNNNPNHLVINGDTRNLTKNQKELMKKFYFVLYENLLLLLQFHFLNVFADEYDDPSMTSNNLQEIERYHLQQEEHEEHLISLLFTSPNHLFDPKKSSSLFSNHHHSSQSNLVIPWKEKYWHVVYQILLVFDTSYQWNASFLDNFLIQITQKLPQQSPSLISFLSKGDLSNRLFMEIICELLLYNHPWIRNVSIRILLHYLQQRISIVGGIGSSRQYFQRLLSKKESSSSTSTSTSTEILLQSNAFYFICRKLCLLMNQKTLKDDFSKYLIQSMLLMISCMFENPELDTAIPDKFQLKKLAQQQQQQPATSQTQQKSAGSKQLLPSSAQKKGAQEDEEDEDDEDDGEVFDEKEEAINERDEFEVMNFSKKVNEKEDIEEEEEVEEEEEKNQKDSDDEDEDEDDEDDSDKKKSNKKRKQSSDDEEDNEDDEEEGEEEEEDENEGKADGEEEEDEAMEVDETNDKEPEGDEEEGGDSNELNDKTFFPDDLNENNPTADDSNANKRGIVWVMNRLRAIGADSRGTRRIRILQLFLQLIQVQSMEFIHQFLPKLMEIPIRVLITHSKQPNATEILTISESLLNQLENIHSQEEILELQYLLSMKVLNLLESKVSTELYFDYYTKIQSFLQQKKWVQKQHQKMEAITNPQAFAEKRLMKNKHKQMQSKRKMSHQMMLKKGKKRRISS